MRTLMTMGAALATAVVAPPPGALAQDSAARAVAPAAAADTVASTAGAARTTPLPFGVGEDLDYMVAVGGARVGTGEMKIADIENIRGHPTFHSTFSVQGGFWMFKVHDVLESWFDTSDLSSRRFIQRINEVNYHKERYFDIYPEKSMLHQQGYDPLPSVSDPLDDGSFLYFVRTVPLVVGQTYVFNRYFRPDKNPVIVKVLRKERVKVPAGTFDAIVIKPIIKSQGIFADGGEAEMWLSDDSRRMMVRFHATVPYLKTLDLYLTSYRPPTDAQASSTP